MSIECQSRVSQSVNQHLTTNAFSTSDPVGPWWGMIPGKGLGPGLSCGGDPS